MSKPTDENPPAFPRNYSADGHNGMNLRDWFAGQALAGMGAVEEIPADTCAEMAYNTADAMLKARGEA